MAIEMQVTGLTIDPVNNAPIVILREKDGGRILPIWIGVIEASAIAFELEQVKLTRPMTHDLLRSCIESLGGRVERIQIVDLRDNTYFAMLLISRDGHTIEIDARPSDAIALALRFEAPIYVEEKVIEKSLQVDDQVEIADDSEEGKKWADYLENLSPEDFGKYKV